MLHQKQIILILLFVQLIAICFARPRFDRPDFWFYLGSPYMDDELHLHSINHEINQNDLIPIGHGSDKEFHFDTHQDSLDRRRKFLVESSHLPSGHNLQGLWAMPGRR